MEKLVGNEALQRTLEELHGDQNRQDNRIDALNNAVEALKAAQSQSGAVIEGYLRIAGSSDPTLSYRHYGIQDGVDTESVFSIFYPCLVGNNLTGDIGVIKHVLRKLGATTATAEDTDFEEGQAVWRDLDGALHAIDGSEGDVMVVNIVPYFQIAGKYEIDGITLDVFIRSLHTFSWKDIDAEQIDPFGESPDYTVAHNDGGTMVMHSVYNPAWNGSYLQPYGVTGRYIVTEENGELIETYDANATILGGAGGLHTTDIALYTGEQYAMNQQGGTSPVPYFNKTARGAELLWAGLAAEGGTFDSHKAILFGSGFCSNDVANADTYADGAEARNGLRVIDKDGNFKYYSFSSNVRFLIGLSEGTLYGSQCVNSFRNPFHIMEAYRALCHAVENSIGELEWFAFDGCKYKYRSVSGYGKPSEGEATAVVFKMVSTKAHPNAIDPADGVTSIAGNRVDIIVAVGLYHGITTQASPSWWTSGLVFTIDENRNYEAYMQRDQRNLRITPNGEKATDESWLFETEYNHVLSITNGEGYRRNYSNDCLMLPDTNANKNGGSLHTHIGAYNYFTSSSASAGKKSVRGFGRGGSAHHSGLSPLYVYAGYAPSGAGTGIGFGTCVQIVSK